MAVAVRVVVILVVLICLLLAFRSAWSRYRPPPTGVVFGQLRNCGDAPNCVCSCDPRPQFLIAALPYQGDRASTEAKLEKVLRAMPRTELERREGDYWHVRFTSALFRFLDDVEFQFKDVGSKIEVRSQSRAGYSDLGVNRQRVEAIRAALTASD